MITRAAIERDLKASLAQTEPTMASIAATTQRVVEDDKRRRKISRFARDAALFADSGKKSDCKRALEKAALALLEWEDADASA